MGTVILIGKIIALLVLCFILARMLSYLKMQLTYYYHSRHIERFLEKKRMSADSYIKENWYIWRHNFEAAPYLKGGGTRAFVWALLCRAREDIAIRNFENNEDLSLYCFGCYFNPTCSIKYYLTCEACKDGQCEKKKKGQVRICRQFMCKVRIAND